MKLIKITFIQVISVTNLFIFSAIVREIFHSFS